MSGGEQNDDGARRGGTSLTQDALRRLRKNRVALLSFWILVGIVVLAVLTPVLPLAPPDRIDTSLDLDPPMGPLFTKAFEFELPTRENAKGDRDGDRNRIRDTKQALDKARAEGARAEGAPADGARAEGAPEAEALFDYRRAVVTARGRVQAPYRDAGFPKLDPLARAMVRLRFQVFGAWEVGPICGRDKLGRDILSRIFWGGRVSLVVGFVATLVSLVIGVTYGMVSGYAGGWVDNAMMRLVDVMYSIPFIFVVIFIISILSADELKLALEYHRIDRTVIFYVVVGAIYWLTMARVVRGQVLSLKNELFVEAAQSLGVPQVAIIFRHILPNLLSIVIVYLTLTIPRVILFEAFLSFLGLGVEPPDVSWGLLANEGIVVISPVRIYWWLILFPSLAIGVTLFALNFLGDGLRDAFDPRLKNR